MRIPSDLIEKHGLPPMKTHLGATRAWHPGFPAGPVVCLRSYFTAGRAPCFAPLSDITLDL